MIVKAGSTSVSTYVVLRSSSTGAALTGATITGISIAYTRNGAALSGPTSLTALANAAAAFAANKGVEVDATNAPGLYRIDWPDAAFASGVRNVILSVSYSGAFSEHVRCELSPTTNQDMDTALSESPTAGTVGEALLYALATGKYKLAISGTTMTLYKSNGTDALKTWTLNSPTAPTSRTP